MKAENAMPGMWIILPGKRKKHFISQVFELNGDNIPEQDRGKILLVTIECRQFVLEKNAELTLTINT